MKCKHTYTDEDFPTNTGSLNRPARFNLRLTCQARARTHAVFSGFRKEFGLAPSTNYAALYEAKLLPTLEHVLRKLRHGDAATRQFFAKLAEPLPKEDHLRAVYQRLKAMFEPSCCRPLAEGVGVGKVAPRKKPLQAATPTQL